ncbi:MAG: hypothetical protein AAGI22_06820 [Planctomycetota bacterium]
MPEEFVRSADLPLVVDPILQSIGFTGGDRQQLDVDAAYDANSERFEVVWSEVESGSDIDVFSGIWVVTPGIFVQPRSVDITNVRWSQPRNASNFEDEQFLCVAVAGPAIGARRVWGRTRSARDSAQGPQFAISGVGAEYVDVGGKGNEIPSAYDFMVVWQEADIINQDFDIVAQTVASDSTLTDGRIVIDGDPGRMDRFPSISKTSGRPGTSNPDSEYMIVWEREVADDDRNIRCQVIEYAGSMAGHRQFRGYSFSDSRRPDVSSWSTYNTIDDERYWVLAFERRTGPNYDIFSVVARDGNADNARSVARMQDLDQDLDQLEPRIANEGQDFLLAYRSPGPGDEDRLFLTSLNVVHDGDELRVGCSFRRDDLAESFGQTVKHGMATVWDGGAPSQPLYALMAWVRTPLVGNTNARGALVTDDQPFVVGSQYCDAAENSTGTSAWMRAMRSSSPQAGQSILLRCNDLPVSSFGYFLCSLQSGFVANPSGSAGNLCLQGAVGRFNRPGEIGNSGPEGTLFLSVDTTDIPTPTGSVAVLAGETWHFQAWFRDLGPTSNFSNGIEVTFD